MNIEKDKQLLSEKELVIRESFADKKGRSDSSVSPYTCYIKINSPEPDMQSLTASLLESLMEDTSNAYIWAMNWDKSIISVSSGSSSFCSLIPTGDQRGKNFVPVSTTRPIDANRLLNGFPEGKLGLLAINSQSQTTDAFLISYFHMVNELIWDIALSKSVSGKPTRVCYEQALELVADQGFMVCVMPEEEIILRKQRNPTTSLRIYGSQVNRFVPQILGAVIR